MFYKKRIRVFVLALAIAGVGVFAGCGSSEDPVEPPAPAPEEIIVENSEPDNSGPAPLEGEILIAAAASLQNTIEGDLIPMFCTENPGAQVVGTYDSSGKLQTQIEEGLDAQIFFSAATKQMDALINGGFIDSTTVTNLLENEVVLITGIQTETGVTGFENILDAASIAIGDPASVPAGQYAEEILTNLGSFSEVESRASLGTNVTEVLNWVAEGSAEVGIVYMTDAASMPDKVRVIASAPEGSLETPVVYPVGLQTGLGDKEETATAFYGFLKGPEALSVFGSYGFKPY